MSQAIRPASQATLEQLMLEVSAGIPLDEAVGVLGISPNTALHVMQQHEMEARVHNLVRVWADAQFALSDGVKPACVDATDYGSGGNVADFATYLLHRQSAGR